MPNYKECRFCSTKFVPEGKELICPGCRAEISKQSLYDFHGGSPVIVEASVPDPVIEAMKQAVADANPEVIPKSIIEEKVEAIAEAVAPIVEAIVKETVPTIPIPDEIMPEPVETQVEKDITVLEDAVAELNKIEDAEIIKDEIIAPAAPKPEEKPDAPS